MNRTASLAMVAGLLTGGCVTTGTDSRQTDPTRNALVNGMAVRDLASQEGSQLTTEENLAISTGAIPRGRSSTAN